MHLDYKFKNPSSPVGHNMFWDCARKAAALPYHKKGVRRMAENNDRKQNGAAGRNTTNTAGVDAGEAAGTVGGGAAGAIVGSIAGPVGTVVGGIAGAALGNQMGEGAGGGSNDAKTATNQTEQNKQR
jgi:outer membrane lipoprotein SlyB